MAKNATSTIPIVFTVSADPVGAGYVASLARPGGNITGLSDFHASTVARRLELVKEVAPAASRVAVLLNPANPTALRQLKSIQAAAAVLHVSAFPVEVRGPGDIDRAFATIGKERSDALLIVPDPSWYLGHQKQIAQLALKNRLPAISTVKTWADAGGLMSYGTNFHDSWRRAATYVDRQSPRLDCPAVASAAGGSCHRLSKSEHRFGKIGRRTPQSSRPLALCNREHR